jgi:O-antigen/teichoic acid export membrane protein
MSPGEPSTPRRSSLRANVRRVLLGNGAYAIGQWLQLVILARAGGPAAVGVYAFALAFTAPVMNLASLQLRMLQASDARRAYAFREYRRVRAGTTVAALLAIAVLARMTGAEPGAWPVLAAVCAMRAADAFSDVYYGAWQQQERMATLGWGLALNALASVAFMGAAVLLGGGVAGAAAGSALGSCTSLAYVHARTAREPDLRERLQEPVPAGARRLARLVAQGAPLALIVLLGSLEHNVPRFFIRQQGGGDGALGLFAAAAGLTAAGGVVVGALGSAATPRIAAACAAGDVRGFRSLTLRIAGIGAALGAAGVALAIAAGEPILALAYGPQFAGAVPVLVVVSGAAGLGFVATLLGYALTAARVIAIQPVVLGLKLGVVGVACAALVPRYGALGAAWAVAIASAAHALANGAVALRHRAAERRSPAHLPAGGAP